MAKAEGLRGSPKWPRGPRVAAATNFDVPLIASVN
jgi:hypothetical protein